MTSTSESCRSFEPTGAQLGRVFQNLVANGLKFHSDEPPRVAVSAERREATWLFSIGDNGVGVPPDLGDEIFSMFKRAHGDDIAGCGIGLAVCRKIVEAHGGAIWAEPAAAAGTVMRVHRPRPLTRVSRPRPLTVGNDVEYRVAFTSMLPGVEHAPRRSPSVQRAMGAYPDYRVARVATAVSRGGSVPRSSLGARKPDDLEPSTPGGKHSVSATQVTQRLGTRARHPAGVRPVRRGRRTRHARRAAWRGSRSGAAG